MPGDIVRIQAEDFIAQNGTQLENTGDVDGNQNVSFISNGDWLNYGEINFVPNMEARVRLAQPGGRPEGTVEFRLDSPTGMLIGSRPVVSTGNWQSYQTFDMSLDPSLEGSHELYVVFRETGTPLTGSPFVNFNWFELEVLPSNLLPDWRVANFGTSENTGVAADDFDADFDGISNLIEYATGLDPNDPDDSSVFEVRESLNNLGELEVAFNRIADPSLTYILQGSGTLLEGDWSSLFSVIGSEDGSVTVPEENWPVDQEGYFFRLGVSY